jgi:hypothetical protein
MSQVVHDSVVAAGRAFGEGVETIGRANAAGQAPPAAGSSVAAAPPAPVAAAPPAPVDFTPEVLRILGCARTAVMAANQPDAAPQVSVSRVWFDGEAFRIPSRAMTARVANLQRDPRATLAINDAESGESVVVTGRVELLYGKDATAGLTAIRREEDPPDGDPPAFVPGDVPVLIVLRPERIIRRGVEGAT